MQRKPSCSSRTRNLLTVGVTAILLSFGCLWKAHGQIHSSYSTCNPGGAPYECDWDPIYCSDDTCWTYITGGPAGPTCDAVGEEFTTAHSSADSDSGFGDIWNTCFKGTNDSSPGCSCTWEVCGAQYYYSDNCHTQCSMTVEENIYALYCAFDG